jgi:hypothetical protein
MLQFVQILGTSRIRFVSLCYAVPWCRHDFAPDLIFLLKRHYLASAGSHLEPSNLPPHLLPLPLRLSFLVHPIASIQSSHLFQRDFHSLLSISASSIDLMLVRILEHILHEFS